MTSSTAGAGESPRQLLADSRRLTRQVRAAQRATWFPLLVFTALTFGAIPVYRFGRHDVTCRSGHGLRVCIYFTNAGLVYWPIALVLAYVVIAAFFLRRARGRGVGTRVMPYVAVGVALAVALGTVALWAAHHPPLDARPLLRLPTGPALLTLTTPAVAIGLALLVLARVQRSVVLAVVAVAYVAFALVPGTALGWVLRFPSPWYFLPRLVIGGAALGIAGLLFAAFERSARHGAP